MANTYKFSNALMLNNSRRLASLPIFSQSNSSAVKEKLGRRDVSPWLVTVILPIPGVGTRRLRIFFVNPRRVYRFSVSRFGRIKGSIVLCLGFLTFLFVMFALGKRFGTRAKKWPGPFIGDPPTLVYKREDLQRIWQWEIASGHYPSRRPIPTQLRFTLPPNNPGIPPQKSSPRTPIGSFANTTKGTGHTRTYLDVTTRPPNVAYPPRPVPGSVADLDIVMNHCDFGQKKYVRDCLEVLRAGAGLDNGNKLKRGKTKDWRYIFTENSETTKATRGTDDLSDFVAFGDTESDPDAGLTRMRGVSWEASPIALPRTVPHRPSASLPAPCDPDHPRVFHMFWTGPFTDKPYTALLSFLFTQNTGLHLHTPTEDTVCRPKMWMWINPGPAASVPNPSALSDMFTQLKTNPWASPFLHPRFKDVVQFRLWNTTEQLDGIPELRDEWRKRDLFNSGGNIIQVPQGEIQTPNGKNSSTTNRADGDNLLTRAGSKSSSTYDRLSVILSDMARFILCHRYGGTYLDADTLFLRDWEELWGWKGAFAYRWSRLKRYNTAVLHMNRRSALGTFLFRTALKNDLDFHPMTISRYTKDAHLEALLLRLPDALFDPAWLNTENWQRDRPAQPYFTDFANFFNTPAVDSAAPQAIGFNGFFKGAYSYHFHNFWWKPFDPSRNWPDLGPRFAAGERLARTQVNVSTMLGHDDDVVDQRDLDWATILKRTFEAYIRGEQPNMYGEWLRW